MIFANGKYNLSANQSVGIATLKSHPLTPEVHDFPASRRPWQQASVGLLESECGYMLC